MIAAAVPSLALCASSRAAEATDHYHSEAVNPASWSPKDWIEIGSVIGGMVAWMWRHSILAVMRWLWDAIRAPARIAAMEARLAALNLDTTTAIGMARITWDTLAAPVWQSDALGKTVHCNRAMLNLLKRPASDILGDNWKQIVHPNDRAAVLAEWHRAVSEGTDFDFTYAWVSADGMVTNIHTVASRILDVTGETIIGWVAFVTVIDTEAERAFERRLVK